jgi:hypothetical protein
MARRGHGLRAFVLVAVVSTTACGQTLAPTIVPGGSPGAGSTGPASSPGPSFAARMDEAAKADLALRDYLREQFGIAGALGPNAAAILAAHDAATVTFGEAGLAELVERFAIDLTASGGPLLWASAGSLRTPSTVTNAEYTGSVKGATSFQVSSWMGFAPEILNQADTPTFSTDSIHHDEAKDYDHDGVREHLVVTEDVQVGAGAGRVTFDVTITADSTFTDVATGQQVGTIVSKSHGKFEVNACPTSEGTAEGEYTITNSEEVGGSGGARGGASSASGKFTVHDDDSAKITSIDIPLTVTTGAHGGVSGDWSLTGTYPISIGPGGETTVGVGTNMGGTDTPQGRSATGYLTAMAASYLGAAAKRAETFWRSGACVEIVADPDSKNVNPKEELKVKVEAKGKFDGREINASVKAAFTGKESLDPANTPQDTPATFTFKAGEKKDDKGTINLEQTSRRGIGKKTVVYTVGGDDYRVANVQGAQYIYSGTKCKGLAGAWTLQLKVGSGTGTVAFTIPESLGKATTSLNFKISVAGTSNTFKMRGSVTPETNAEGATTLILKIGSGTLVQKSKNGTATLQFTDPTTDRIPLEQGSFCGS